MAFIDSIYKIEPQLGNQWDISFDSLRDSKYDMIYKVQDVSLPFYKLETETKYTGEKVYKSLVEPSEISITLREDNNFNTFQFFNNWFGSIYDLTNRVFKTQDNLQSNLLDATLRFYKLNPIALNIPLTGTFSFIPGFDIEKPSYGFKLLSCKIQGVEPLSLSYEGNPLMFSVSMVAEEIHFVKY